MAELSGGERRRLQLLRILMAEPNVLVLDEPTNDLDTDTLGARWRICSTAGPARCVVVSHDRYLVERVTDDVVALLGDGRITHLPGGIDEYLRRRARGDRRTGGLGSAGRVASDRRLRRPRRQRRRPANVRALRKDLQRLERRLESLQRKESDAARPAGRARRRLRRRRRTRTPSCGPSPPTGRRRDSSGSMSPSASRADISRADGSPVRRRRPWWRPPRLRTPVPARSADPPPQPTQRPARR